MSVNRPVGILNNYSMSVRYELTDTLCRGFMWRKRFLSLSMSPGEVFVKKLNILPVSRTLNEAAILTFKKIHPF